MEFKGTDIPLLEPVWDWNWQVRTASCEWVQLKEVLVPKVRLLIDTLPFAPEAFFSGNSNIKRKVWKSEVSAAHIQCIASLSVLTNSSPNRIISD